MKDSKAYFDTIYVIEALRADDLHTGRKLFDELQFLALAARPEVSCRLIHVNDAADLLRELAAIRTQASNGEFPMLHIETHGDAEGIQMASGETLPWSKLQTELTTINAACRLNLLVVLAACEGANLMSVIQPSQRAAVRGIIGPKRSVSSGEVERAGLAFFQRLLSSRSASQAYSAMNDAIPKGDRPFLVATAEYLFKETMRQYFKTMCSEEALEKRELRTYAFRVPTSEHEIESFRAYQRNHRLHFEQRRTHFFFCDRYPENRERFPLTFEECLSA